MDHEELNNILSKLKGNAETYAKLSTPERIRLLKDLLRKTLDIADPMVRASCEAKSIRYPSPVSGEERLQVVFSPVRNIRLLIESLQGIVRYGLPPLPGIRSLSNGRTVVRVFPTNTFDKILFPNFTGEVWMQPHVSIENFHHSIAVKYQNPPEKGKVSLILGAGNVAGIPFMDALYKLFVEKEVVILKLNPVNQYIGPYLMRIFDEFIERGFMAIVEGRGEEGNYLAHHEDVNNVHITGSIHTHDAIVWGPKGIERDTRLADDNPLLKKQITSELGNVSPVVVVPGEWSDKELNFQAENVVSMLTNNNGFNCIAVKLLVLSEGWAQKNLFLDLISSKFSEVPTRKAYYPGSVKQFERFVSSQDKKNVRLMGTPKEGELPWAMILNVDATQEDHICFREEPFCPIVAVTELSESNPATFLQTATEFCNEVVWGTLNISILVTPSSERKPDVKISLARAIEKLRYGAITINHWGALPYTFVSPPWGGYPGQSLHDAQSGIGWVHNSYLLENIEKTVIRGPITFWPKPVWFYSNKECHTIAKKLVHFEAAPSVAKLASIIMSALGG